MTALEALVPICSSLPISVGLLVATSLLELTNFIFSRRGIASPWIFKRLEEFMVIKSKHVPIPFLSGSRGGRFKRGPDLKLVKNLSGTFQKEQVSEF